MGVKVLEGSFFVVRATRKSITYHDMRIATSKSALQYHSSLLAFLALRDTYVVLLITSTLAGFSLQCS